ncbi:hypothetical protein [Colwellia sp. E2M01]|uniref:hypothetical protein n=1 Tax=Colwellia sp. E2M01 TaxID=2841561 RepID=UPI001C09E216|nr:hypothetical protein [Colwellia sp. E2M01]MBU2869738.1 hypothetical protein [Colwellia sp. E2M01]
MSIFINVGYIIKVNGSDRLKIDPEKFSALSLLILQLLRLHVSSSENKKKIEFFIENHKILVTYDESKTQYDHDESNIEIELMKGLESTIHNAQKYCDLIHQKGVGRARDFNLSNNELPSKAVDILSKLEGDDIKLVAGKNSVKLSKMPKIGKHESSYIKGSLKSCRVNKPDYIRAAGAIFCGEVDNKKFTATLAIPDDLVQKVWDAGYNQIKVDIEFEYLERLKDSRKFTGTLTSIKESKVIDTNHELDF